MQLISIPAIRGRFLAILVVGGLASFLPAETLAGTKVAVEQPNVPLELGDRRKFVVVNDAGNTPAFIDTTVWRLRSTAAGSPWVTMQASSNKTYCEYDIIRVGEFEVECEIKYREPGMGMPKPADESPKETLTSVGPNQMAIIAGTTEQEINGNTITITYQMRRDGSPIG